MKNMFLVLTAIAAMMWSCGQSGGKGNDTEGDIASETEKELFTIGEPVGSSLPVNTEATTVKWHGQNKIIDKHHYGSVKVSQGTLWINTGSNIITGGKVVIDMTSIDNDDLKGTEKLMDLVGHLKSPDFFEVETYPTAVLEIAGSEYAEEGDELQFNIKANLTIKGVTKPITFPARVTHLLGVIQAEAKFIIDRSEWNVQYGSESFFKNLGDKAISNDIEFEVTLVAGTPQTPEI